MADTLLARTIDAFRGAFGGAPARVARAPGRVNLIGEHTDYNDGFVLPAAIGVETLAAVRPRANGLVRVFAADYQSQDEFHVDDPFTAVSGKLWAHYVRGTIRALADDGFALSGADVAICGDIPQGAGLSSSASLEVAVGLAMAASCAAEIDRTRLAKLAQRAENDFVGCKCGVMDQLISASGVAGAALLIDCRSLARMPAPIPPDIAILIVHSGVVRGLVDGEYNARRDECERAARALGVPALRDASIEQLNQSGDGLDETAYRRARHVLTENQRTLKAADAIKAGDLPTLGRLMAESHASLRDDFNVTTPAVDALVAILQDAIGAEGGARMTGGGFGGCVVALAHEDRTEAVLDAVRRRYHPPNGKPLMILKERATAGASFVAF